MSREFIHPLVSRYASREMVELWGPQHRHETWRRVWVALAEAQRDAGLNISTKQINAMKRAVAKIDFEAAAKYEAETRHDVMAHIHAFGDAAPSARGIIHLGATSMDVVDNADLVLTRDAIDLVIGRLAAAIQPLLDFCEKYADLPALGFTHLQPAQLTTVGKRAALWLQDLMTDLRRLSEIRKELRARGLRGATGTQASFLKLLGSATKVRNMEQHFTKSLGFDKCYDICGQTYSRKVDIEVINALASFAAGVQKICNDIRILAMLKEIEEPFGKKQVGSSAMPYKRNPAKCERATGLARYLMSLATSPPMTLADQMLERTLDDSSNKRLVFPEAFLTADALAILLHSIFDGLVVYPATIRARVMAELPFIASENILMAAVAQGGDRQQLHERIRDHAQQAGQLVKNEGKPNDLIERLQKDPAFAGIDLSKVLEPGDYVGLAPKQTREFVRGCRRELGNMKLPKVQLSTISV
ncbi:MAG: adenylosuccinate lyase [Phycisphaerae bacterium]